MCLPDPANDGSDTNLLVSAIATRLWEKGTTLLTRILCSQTLPQPYHLRVFLVFFPNFLRRSTERLEFPPLALLNALLSTIPA